MAAARVDTEDEEDKTKYRGKERHSPHRIRDGNTDTAVISKNLSWVLLCVRSPCLGAICFTPWGPDVQLDHIVRQ